MHFYLFPSLSTIIFLIVMWSSPFTKYLFFTYVLHTSVQFSCSVMSDCLQSHGLQHGRRPCVSPTPGAHSNSCPLSWWCHPTFSSSVILFSSCLQSFPKSGSFLMSQFFTSGGQSIGASASASVPPVNIQDWFPLELTSLISLQSKGLSRVFSNTTVHKHRFFSTQPSALKSTRDYWTNHSFDYVDLCWQSNICFLICCLGLS